MPVSLYRITDQTERAYVGVTSSPLRYRLQAHRTGKTSSRRVREWVNQNAVVIEELQTFESREEALVAEQETYDLLLAAGVELMQQRPFGSKLLPSLASRRAKDLIETLVTKGTPVAEIAAQLNDQEMPSLSGRPWTVSMVNYMKFFRS